MMLVLAAGHGLQDRRALRGRSGVTKFCGLGTRSLTASTALASRMYPCLAAAVLPEPS